MPHRAAAIAAGELGDLQLAPLEAQPELGDEETEFRIELDLDATGYLCRPIIASDSQMIEAVLEQLGLSTLSLMWWHTTDPHSSTWGHRLSMRLQRYLFQMEARQYLKEGTGHGLAPLTDALKRVLIRTYTGSVGRFARRYQGHSAPIFLTTLNPAEQRCLVSGADTMMRHFLSASAEAGPALESDDGPPLPAPPVPPPGASQHQLAWELLAEGTTVPAGGPATGPTAPGTEGKAKRRQPGRGGRWRRDHAPAAEPADVLLLPAVPGTGGSADHPANGAAQSEGLVPGRAPAPRNVFALQAPRAARRRPFFSVLFGTHGQRFTVAGRTRGLDTVTRPASTRPYPPEHSLDPVFASEGDLAAMSTSSSGSISSISSTGGAGLAEELSAPEALPMGGELEPATVAQRRWLTRERMIRVYCDSLPDPVCAGCRAEGGGPRHRAGRAGRRPGRSSPRPETGPRARREPYYHTGFEAADCPGCQSLHWGTPRYPSVTYIGGPSIDFLASHPSQAGARGPGYTPSASTSAWATSTEGSCASTPAASPGLAGSGSSTRRMAHRMSTLVDRSPLHSKDYSGSLHTEARPNWKAQVVDAGAPALQRSPMQAAAPGEVDLLRPLRTSRSVDLAVHPGGARPVAAPGARVRRATSSGALARSSPPGQDSPPAGPPPSPPGMFLRGLVPGPGPEGQPPRSRPRTPSEEAEESDPEAPLTGDLAFLRPATVAEAAALDHPSLLGAGGDAGGAFGEEDDDEDEDEDDQCPFPGALGGMLAPEDPTASPTEGRRRRFVRSWHRMGF
ncbi:hypothetical protein H696_02497 [Fonticula alba]|uniref:Uncharacterized protein n=1 Tax=Fonticula alba TaxID=691883 RepID=A0A058ZDL6_FONAL|nr:hypothetical protein H696_02497 [Fonticula alba]KCV71557.1 hypothetical protein H696_02497 [Fonticula alba]|eukprot:XP_009494680.1 hypothetical protein H696_02497 [Fonticula alba]